MRRRQSTITMTVNTNRHDSDDSTLAEDSPFLLKSDTTLNEQELDVEAEQRARRMRTKVILLILAMIVAVDLPSVLQSSPQLRIMEDIFCKAYYKVTDPLKISAEGTIDEQSCKIDSVQADVAFLKGWLSFFNHLPGLFLAIPYGMLADKYGRKWLLVLNIVQLQLRACFMYLVLSFPDFFPIRIVWAEAILGLLGGGSMVATALLFTIVSDVTPSSQTASTFFRLGATNFFCFLAAPPLAAKLMEISPWIPYSLGLAVQAVAIPITLALPETLGFQKPADPTPPTPKPFSKEEETEAERPLTASEPSLHLQRGSVFKTIKSLFASLIANSAFLFADWRVLFVLSTYPVRMLLGPLEGLLMQYVSKRFHWALARVTYITSFQAGLSMLALLFIFPWISTYLLKKRGLNAASKDLWLARVGITATAIGLLVQGLAPTVFFLFVGIGVGAMGSCSGAALRALLTGWVQQNEVARLYTALSIVETLGVTAGGPIVAGLFKMAMVSVKDGKSGDFWLGLPFLLIGGLFAVSAALMWVMRFGERRESGVEDGNGEK